MISDASVFVVRWLAPILYLSSLLLSLFAFLGPVQTFHTVTLLTISPMNITNGEIFQTRSLLPAEDIGRRLPRAGVPLVLSQQVEGPSVYVGALGSCSKTSLSAPEKCPAPVWFPTYDYSVLPGSAPKPALPPSPPDSSPEFYLAAIVLSFIFFIASSIASLADILPSAPKGLVRLNSSGQATRLITSIGMGAFVIGLLASIIWRVSFGRDVQQFNVTIATTKGSPNLYASLGNGFTMMWVAYAFQAPLLICYFFRIHSQAIAAKA